MGLTPASTCTLRIERPRGGVQVGPLPGDAAQLRAVDVLRHPHRPPQQHPRRHHQRHRARHRGHLPHHLVHLLRLQEAQEGVRNPGARATAGHFFPRPCNRRGQGWQKAGRSRGSRGRAGFCSSPRRKCSRVGSPEEIRRRSCFSDPLARLRAKWLREPLAEPCQTDPWYVITMM